VTQLKEYGATDDGFRRIVLDEQYRGILTLDMEHQPDQDAFMFLEMHPKLEGGKFRDNNEMAVFSRIDDLKEAKTALTSKQNRANAMFVATQMTAAEVKDFACAMGWSETDELEIIRNNILEIADNDPEWFKNFLNNKSLEYRAVVKRAMDNNLIAWQPVESKFVWVSNGQTIATLDRVENNKVLDRMSDWIVSSKNGHEVYNKLKAMLKQPA
jgi:hypothetical protein